MSEALNLTASQQARVNEIREAQIGKRIDVRFSPKQKVTGIIKSVTPAFWSGSRLAFEVELVCGVNQVVRKVNICTFESAR